MSDKEQKQQAPVITPDEAQALLKFLDRCEVKGHEERNAMNVVCNKIFRIANPGAKLGDPPIDPPTRIKRPNPRKKSGKKSR